MLSVQARRGPQASRRDTLRPRFPAGGAAAGLRPGKSAPCGLRPMIRRAFLCATALAALGAAPARAGEPAAPAGDTRPIAKFLPQARNDRALLLPGLRRRLAPRRGGRQGAHRRAGRQRRGAPRPGPAARRECDTPSARARPRLGLPVDRGLLFQGVIPRGGAPRDGAIFVRSCAARPARSGAPRRSTPDRSCRRTRSNKRAGLPAGSFVGAMSQRHYPPPKSVSRGPPAVPMLHAGAIGAKRDAML